MTLFYYFDKGGQKRGPFSGSQLKWFAKQGSITPETVIENEEGKTAPAREMNGLTFAETPPVEVNPFTAALPTAAMEADPFTGPVPKVPQPTRPSTTVPVPVVRRDWVSLSVNIVGFLLIAAAVGIAGKIIYDNEKKKTESKKPLDVPIAAQQPDMEQKPFPIQEPKAISTAPSPERIARRAPAMDAFNADQRNQPPPVPKDVPQQTPRNRERATVPERPQPVPPAPPKPKSNFEEFCAPGTKYSGNFGQGRIRVVFGEFIGQPPSRVKGTITFSDPAGKDVVHPFTVENKNPVVGKIDNSTLPNQTVFRTQRIPANANRTLRDAVDNYWKALKHYTIINIRFVGDEMQFSLVPGPDAVLATGDPRSFLLDLSD